MDFFKERSIKQNESFLARRRNLTTANIYISDCLAKIANNIKSLLHPYRGPYGRLFLLLKGGSV